jgi:hypothetical protein
VRNAEAWLGATAYLTTRRTVFEALAKSAYGTAIVLLLVPLIAFGSSSEPTDLSTRVVLFIFMLGGLAIPVAIAAGIGLVIDRYAPTHDENE